MQLLRATSDAFLVAKDPIFVSDSTIIEPLN